MGAHTATASAGYLLAGQARHAFQPVGSPRPGDRQRLPTSLRVKRPRPRFPPGTQGTCGARSPAGARRPCSNPETASPSSSSTDSGLTMTAAQPWGARAPASWSGGPGSRAAGGSKVNGGYEERVCNTAPGMRKASLEGRDVFGDVGGMGGVRAGLASGSRSAANPWQMMDSPRILCGPRA